MKLLKLKNWQMFLLLIALQALSKFELPGSPILENITNAIGVCAFMFWPIVIGYEINNLLPVKLRFNDTLFVVNAFLITISIVLLLVGFEGTQVSGSGLAALPILYLIYAFFHIFSFAAKVLKTAEINKKAQFGEYFWSSFMLLSWPIGVWFVQDRINRVVERLEMQEMLRNNQTQKL